MAEPEPETEFDFRQSIRDIPQFVEQRARDQARADAQERLEIGRVGFLGGMTERRQLVSQLNRDIPPVAQLRRAQRRTGEFRTFARGLFQRTPPQPAQTSPIQVLNRDLVSKIGNFL